MLMPEWLRIDTYMDGAGAWSLTAFDQRLLGVRFERWGTGERTLRDAKAEAARFFCERVSG